MAWSAGNSLGSNSAASGATIAITTGAVHNAGERIVVWIAWGQNTRTLSSVTDSAGNTYTILRTKLLLNKCVGIAVSNGANALGAGGTITATLSASSATGIMSCAKAYVGGTVSKDGDTDANGAAASDAAVTWTPAQATELALAGIASISTAGGDYATPAGWTNVYDFKCTGVSLCLRADHAIGLASGVRTDTWVGTLKNAWNVVLESLLLSVPSSGGGDIIPCTGAG